MSQLFRTEAIEHAKARPLGTILLARPISHAVLTGFFAVLALSLVAFLANFSYTRKARVPGVLLPSQGLIRVLPMQAGQVVSRRVQEGQAVQAGDVLFVLVSQRAYEGTGNVEASVSALIQQRRESFLADQAHLQLLTAQRVGALQRRALDLEGEKVRVGEQLTMQERRVALAQAALERQKELLQASFVSAVQVQERQAELLDQQLRLGDLQRARAVVERDLAAARSEVGELQIQARRDQEAARRSVGSTDQELAENEARRQWLVRAPQAGVVTAITANEGQSVLAAQVLASVLPQGALLEAELYAPSRAAGFLKPGMTVSLRYDAYSYQKFGQAQGTIKEVSSTAMRPEEFAISGAGLQPGGTAEPVYRVRVTLPSQTITAFGSQVSLRSGALLDASVMLETRRLYEWVLEPLHTIKGRV